MSCASVKPQFSIKKSKHSAASLAEEPCVENRHPQFLGEESALPSPLPLPALCVVGIYYSSARTGGSQRDMLLKRQENSFKSMGFSKPFIVLLLSSLIQL